MGFFAGALALGKTFFGSSVGKMVGTAVLSKALAPKQIQVRPAELRYAQQTETNDANLEVMRQKAEQAGFNPLTVLRAGGINAYATRKTNIPSYAPALYATKGPSYIETIAGAAAQSYFNRPTEEQKASQALKIAQQYADLDYTRVMTAGARNAGKGFSMRRGEPQVTDPKNLEPVEPVSEFSKTSTVIGKVNVSEKVKPILYGYKSPFTENSWWLPWEEAGVDEMIGGVANFGLVTSLDAISKLGDLSETKNSAYRKMAEDRKEYWSDAFRFPPLAEPSSSVEGKLPYGALFDSYMRGLEKAGKWPNQ